MLYIKSDIQENSTSSAIICGEPEDSRIILAKYSIYFRFSIEIGFVRQSGSCSRLKLGNERIMNSSKYSFLTPKTRCVLFVVSEKMTCVQPGLKRSKEPVGRMVVVLPIVCCHSPFVTKINS